MHPVIGAKVRINDKSITGPEKLTQGWYEIQDLYTCNKIQDRYDKIQDLYHTYHTWEQIMRPSKMKPNK